MGKNNECVIIIPVSNESSHIQSVVKEISPSALPVVIVDDGSTDDSVRLAKELTPHVLRHDTNLGKGAAMQTGAEYAFYSLGAKYCIFMDGDGQHSAQDIEQFVSALKAGHDRVFGIRDIWRKMPRHRGLGNRAVSQYVAWRFGVYIPDILSGYKGFSRAGYESVKWEATGYEVELEIAVRVARQKLSFQTLSIETIYHSLDRGMNVLDALHLLTKLPLW